MGKASRPRRGSLQYWPRKRAEKILPSVNWRGITQANSDKKLLGFIGYKVGMKSLFVKDNTNESMTKGKRISIPITILECPPLKILSVRFYKNKKVASEILSNDLDKTLIRKIKFPKKNLKKINEFSDFDDVRIITYSLVKTTTVKKKPDVVEIALSGTKEEKVAWIKEHLNKEIKISEVFNVGGLTDIRGVTKGKGIQGPVKRFGITLRSHKAEKGQRKTGSLGPWHPARVIFRVPMAGQLGMFTRAVYNNKIIKIGKSEELNLRGIAHYGDVKTDYVLIRGSIQGPQKRSILLTYPLIQTKRQMKKS